MADDSSEQIDQDEIEKLLQQAQSGAAPQSSSPPADASDENEVVGQDEIEQMLSQSKSSAPAPDPAAAQQPEAVEDGDKVLGQSDIEALLEKSQGGADAKPAAAKPAAAAAPASPAAQPTGENEMAQGDVELLLRKAEEALASIDEPQRALPEGIAEFELDDFSGAPPSTEAATLDLIRDVELDLKIELGRTNMYLEEVLKLRRGSVVPLDKLAGDPVDIYVNGRLIARGEVLVLNDNFCVRVAELVAGEPAVHC